MPSSPSLPPLSILVAHYANKQFEELLQYLDPAEATVVVYDKSVNGYSTDRPNTRIRRIPNISREGYSYLTYIIDEYDSLPDYTAFIQDDTANHLSSYEGYVAVLREVLRQNLGGYHFACMWNNQHKNIRCTRTITKGIHADFTPPDAIALTCSELGIPLREEYQSEICSFFVWSREHIQSKPKAFYETLREWLVQHEFNEIILEHMWMGIF